MNWVSRKLRRRRTWKRRIEIFHFFLRPFLPLPPQINEMEIFSLSVYRRRGENNNSRCCNAATATILHCSLMGHTVGHGNNTTINTKQYASLTLKDVSVWISFPDTNSYIVETYLHAHEALHPGPATFLIPIFFLIKNHSQSPALRRRILPVWVPPPGASVPARRPGAGRSDRSPGRPPAGRTRTAAGPGPRGRRPIPPGTGGGAGGSCWRCCCSVVGRPFSSPGKE